MGNSPKKKKKKKGGSIMSKIIKIMKWPKLDETKRKVVGIVSKFKVALLFSLPSEI